MIPVLDGDRIVVDGLIRRLGVVTAIDGAGFGMEPGSVRGRR
jgi:hypothetical protein